ncbi:PRD domain-containing protein [Saccharibacillus sp. CPCC 101409]|uniref:BglG family transcription antiterminator LicT n=1 Tax=Saccharibacillus sp. CPCC 101409 TaxID=3058041 RepID=UPI002670F8C6|nr:PRD domain-containing protein [Saccharibacillus sp. CPCC 101409]MDO3409445.1 PRD domain-containing protein [Saccharibacillus sp. CPCC 101409]
MRIIKKLNNSVVIATDDEGRETVVMGKGIGCNYEMGSVLSQGDVERVFVLKDEKTSSDVIRLSRDIPDVYFDVSSRVIRCAKRTLKAELNEHIYVALTDHIYFAVQRHKQNVVVQNRLLWEVKKFYPEEFKIGKYALNVLLEELNIVFPEEEAGNIAFHLVNAQQSSDDNMALSTRITGVIKDILNIVSYQFGIALDHESLNYSRFVTHLQYFAQRLIENMEVERDEGFLYDQVRSTYVKEFECAGRIRKYIEKNFDRTISNSELIYLTIHIHRVVNRS